MATYVSLVNELLRRLNETTLDETIGDGFTTARNLQAIAKDAINSSLREIFQTSQEWPFLITTYTETLTAGTGVYAWQTDVSKVDWDTFYLKRLDSAENEPKLLPVITYEDYLRYHRPKEETSGTSGRTIPTTVFKTQERKYGVTPVPDAAYQIEYRYWSFPNDLASFSDTTVVPARYKHIIIDGAMMYMMRFKSNEQSAALHQQKFNDGIDVMRRLLLDAPRYISSTAIQKNHIMGLRVING